MKILLVTTGKNNNPGDQFIRLGVQSLVSSVCPEAVFERINKEDHEDITRERPFDKIILCGMPLWWDNSVSFSADIHWWEPLMRGWLSERKKDFLILGAGSVVGQHPFNAARFGAAVDECVERAFAVVTRNHVMDHPGLINSICPAAFSTFDLNVPADRQLKVCNLMPSGAHDAHLNEAEAATWRQKVLPELATALLSKGFLFCAHDQVEYYMARSLGWADPRLFDTPEEYIAFYRRAKLYVGNRLHAGVVVAASGGAASVVGYDSRIEMVRPFTRSIFKPSEISSEIGIDDLVSGLNVVGRQADPSLLKHHRSLQQGVLRQFLSS